MEEHTYYIGHAKPAPLSQPAPPSQPNHSSQPDLRSLNVSQMLPTPLQAHRLQQIQQRMQLQERELQGYEEARRHIEELEAMVRERQEEQQREIQRSLAATESKLQSFLEEFETRRAAFRQGYEEEVRSITN